MPHGFVSVLMQTTLRRRSGLADEARGTPALHRSPRRRDLLEAVFEVLDDLVREDTLNSTSEIASPKAS